MGFNSKVCCNTIVTVMYSTMVYTRYILNIKGGGHAKIQKYFFCINEIFDMSNSP